MKTKFTPEYVLKMLQEIKELSDQDNFYSSTLLSKKYPSFYHFRKILSNKGIITNSRGKNKWLSIIPNIIMAKEVLRLFFEKREQSTENWMNKKLNESYNENNYQINDKIDNKIEITKNNINPISILEANLNSHFLEQNESMKIDFTSFAKLIRKEGEKWNDAISRASKILKSIDVEIPVKRGRGRPRKTPTINDLLKTTKIDNKKWNDAMKNANVIIEDNVTKQINPEPNTIKRFRKLTIEELFPMAYKQDFEKLKQENDELKQQLEFKKLANFDNNNKIYDKLNKKIEELEFQLNIETTANGCFKQRITELEKIPSSARNFKSIHEKEIQNLTNKIESSNKDLENYKEKYEDLEKRNKKYIAEYSAFINEKLEVIEDLKKQLHQHQSEKNQVSVIKVLGITLIKKTTKTIR